MLSKLDDPDPDPRSTLKTESEWILINIGTGFK